MKSKQYYSYLNLLRILAILAVITIHTSGRVLYDEPILSLNWWAANFFNSCSRWCIPVFVMISGAVLLGNHTPPVKYFLIKRVKRVMIAGVFWVIAYYIYTQMVRQQPLNFYYLIKILLRFHDSKGLSYHLWYLPVIIGLYFATPVIHIFISNASNKMVLYFILLWFCFSIAFPFFKNILHLSIGIESTIFVQYAGYFILGHYLHSNAIKLKNIISILLFIVGVFCTSVGMSYLSSKSGKVDTFFLGYGTPNVMMMSAFIFLLIKNTDFHFLDHSFFKKIGDSVFGIFLAHILFLDPLIYAHNRLLNPVEKIGPTFGIPVSILIVFLLSLSLVMLLKKIPIFKHVV